MDLRLKRWLRDRYGLRVMRWLYVTGEARKGAREYEIKVNGKV